MTKNLQLVPGKTGSPNSPQRAWNLVRAEEVLFAEMSGRVPGGDFSHVEIERLAGLFGLTAAEVGELYRCGNATPAEEAAPRPRRRRSIRVV